MSAVPPPSGHDSAAASGAAEQDLRNALREVRELLHDIRNHLNGILGLVSVLLLQSTDPVSARVRPLIEAQALQLMHLIDKVPASVGAPARRQGHPAPFVASRFIPALVDLYRPFAAEFGVRLAHGIDDHTAPVLLDARSLHRLLSNLLVNAIKHSQASQVTVFAGPDTAGMGLRFVVADDGVGIASQAVSSLQAILDGQRDPGPPYDGTGLAICARMAAQLGAAISLQSTLGEGTRVTIGLKAAEPPREAA